MKIFATFRSLCITKRDIWMPYNCMNKNFKRENRLACTAYTEMPWHNWTHLTKKTAPLSAKHCIQIAMYFRKLLTFSRVVMLHFCATITSWFVLVLFLILLFIYVCALYVMSTSIKSGKEYFVLRGGFWLQFKDAPLYFHYKYYSVC